MVDGVAKGYQKTLEIQGVGYKAEAKPYGVNLIVGLLPPGEVRGARRASRSRSRTTRW